MTRTSLIHVALGCACLCLTACGKKDDRPGAASSALGTGVATVLATIPDGAKPPAPILPPGLGLHGGPRTRTFEFFFGERGGGVAFVVEAGKKSKVIFNGRPGKEYSAVGKIALSPDGGRHAYAALADGRWRMVVDGVEAERSFDAVKTPVFSADGAHLAYEVMDGERWRLAVDGKLNPGTRTRYLAHEFSADGSRIAYIDDVDSQGRGRLVVSDVAFGEQETVATGVISMLVSADRSKVAAVMATRGAEVLSFAFARPDLVERGPRFDGVRDLAFSADGRALAYFAERAGEHFAVLNDKEERIPPVEIVGPPVIRPDGKSFGALVAVEGLVFLRIFFVEWGANEGSYEEADGLTFSQDGSSHAYAARRGAEWYVVVNGLRGEPFDRVVTPQISPDGSLVVYRARKQGSRFVVAADARGKTVSRHASFEQVHPVRFAADGKSIAYGALDGSRLLWRVEAP